MIELTLKATKREGTGKGVTRKLREQKIVPAVAYGSQKDSMILSVDYQELFKVLHGEAGEHALINLEVDGKDAVKCVVKDIQRDPVTYEILHVDFLLIDMNKPIQITVPLELENTEIAKGVKEGGVLEHILKDVLISCLPANIPNHLKLDVSELGLGDNLTISDAKFENVEILNHNDDDVIVSVVVPRGTAEAEEEEGEEGEEIAVEESAE